MSEKNLELERLVFFSDTVVAIAITLFALDLRIEKRHQAIYCFLISIVVAIILCFIRPLTAFTILFTRLPTILLANQAFGKRRTRPKL